MRLQDVMSTDVRTVAPTVPAEDAWTTMRLHNMHHLVVTDAERIVGVFSDRDAGGRRGAPVRVNRTVADLMTTPAVTAEPETTIRQAANMMRGRSIGCLIVVRSGKAIGIVTVSDLLELLGRGHHGVVDGQRWTLNHRVPHRKSHGPAKAW